MVNVSETVARVADETLTFEPLSTRYINFNTVSDICHLWEEEYRIERTSTIRLFDLLASFSVQSGVTTAFAASDASNATRLRFNKTPHQGQAAFRTVRCEGLEFPMSGRRFRGSLTCFGRSSMGGR